MAKIVRLAPAPEREGLPAPRPAETAEVLELAATNARRGIFGVMATVLARRGSAPSTPGQKLYVTLNEQVGTVGGGAIEREVLEACIAMAKSERREHVVRTFALGESLGMCCGGSVDVLVEPIEAKHPLLVIGGGHVARATAPLLARVGFAVTVVDAREAWGGQEIEGVRSVAGEFDEIGRSIPDEAVVLVMTHDHALDQRAIEWALRRKFAYVGGIGSRAKAKRTRDRLEHKGFSTEDIERVRMPIGVAVGARLPDEIAVAIAAEMVSWRRQSSKTTSG